MKKLFFLTLIFAISSYTSSSASESTGDALLIGEDSPSLKVMIRTIDDGEILWVGNYTLDTKAVVAPGEHIVDAMCEFRYSWGTKMAPGKININAQSNTDYKITGLLSDDERSCKLSVSIKQVT